MVKMRRQEHDLECNYLASCVAHTAQQLPSSKFLFMILVAFCESTLRAIKQRKGRKDQGWACLGSLLVCVGCPPPPHANFKSRASQGLSSLSLL